MNTGTCKSKCLNCLYFVGFIFLSLSGFAQNYQLVWEDQFNGNSLDPTKWNTENRVGIWNTGGNSEFQHYKNENVTVGDDGNGNNCLIITAKEESFGGYHYTSGRVNTRGKFAFRRGKLEASIKIPDLANGLWPAFWTLGYTPIGWPDCGEIDVLEMGHAEGIRQGKVNSFIGAHLFWGPYPRD
jgi:beta-glucanase (GH16 family)